MGTSFPLDKTNHSNRRPRTILVVDDEVDICELVTSTLELFGYQTVAASDGIQALQMIRTCRPDAMTLDLAMPRMDGHAVLAGLAADPATSGLPVIVLSAYTGSLIPTTQVKRVLPKPFEISDLLDAVETVTSH
jgi:CheY-like chemotaxis protein